MNTTKVYIVLSHTSELECVEPTLTLEQAKKAAQSHLDELADSEDKDFDTLEWEALDREDTFRPSWTADYGIKCYYLIEEWEIR